jgi:thiosulfate dehydrogenase
VRPHFPGALSPAVLSYCRLSQILTEAEEPVKKFLIGLIVGVVLIPLGAYLFVVAGQAPVATSQPPLPFERFFAKTALRARVNRLMPKTVPLTADEATFMAGAQVYRHHCAMCHGLINGPISPIARGMFPYPPQLLENGHGVTDDPPGETFWKAKNGIRLSGMPGFHATLNDTQLWQVSLMLANADKLSAAVKAELIFVPRGGPGAGLPPPEKAMKK